MRICGNKLKTFALLPIVDMTRIEPGRSEKRTFAQVRRYVE